MAARDGPALAKKEEITSDAASLQVISIRLITVFRCVRSNSALLLSSPTTAAVEFASTGIQSRSMHNVFVMREIFSTMPSTNNTPKRNRRQPSLWAANSRGHTMQQDPSATRLARFVTRSGRRREGAASTHRPRAGEKSRTQIVSAMPWSEEGRSVPGKALWMKTI